MTRQTYRIARNNMRELMNCRDMWTDEYFNGRMRALAVALIGYAV